MKKVIRRGVFETNSSSCHSISVQGADGYCDDKGWGEFIFVETGEFGWGYEELFGVHNKLSYVITSIQYYDQSVGDSYENLINSEYFIWLSEMVKDYTGATLIVNKSDCRYSPIGYIDHDSTHTLSGSVYENVTVHNSEGKVRDGFWSYDKETFKENMKEFVFNNTYYIIVDNDNRR